MSSFRSGRCLVIAAIALAVPLALAGCSASSHSQAQASPTPTATAGARSGGTGGRAGQGFPGVSGEIAAIQAKTLQVQGSGQQTAVTYSGSTAITQTVSGSLSDVAVGDCVTGITASGSGSSTSGAAATSVTISEASSSGTCTGGFGGFGGTHGGSSGTRGGFSGTRPSGFPTPPAGSGRPTFRPGTSGRSGFTPPVSGLVTAVGSSTITVKETLPAQGLVVREHLDQEDHGRCEDQISEDVDGDR